MKPTAHLAGLFREYPQHVENDSYNKNITKNENGPENEPNSVEESNSQEKEKEYVFKFLNLYFQIMTCSGAVFFA